MTNQQFFLKENVFVEPLVNNWYAWPNLISPIPYSMYMVKTHLRLMKSFVNNYELHIIANQNPEMAGGGEFVDCSAEQVEDVKRLIEKFENEGAIFKELADSVSALDDLIKSHKSGETIEPLYDQVPEHLKGYVELFMDLYHNPSYRLIEGLLYDSEYYKRELQSVSFGILDDDANRPFVLSTPRLADQNNIQLRLPFASPLWDIIFKARELPISKAQIDQVFQAGDTQGGLDYMELFTTEPPSLTYQAPEQGSEASYIGHAGFMVHNKEVAVVIDPVIAYRTNKIKHDVISFSQLPPKIDYLCLTHNHSDHVNIESLLQIRHKVDTVLVPKNNGGSLCDPSLKLILQQIGFKVMELEDMEVIGLPEGKLMSIPFLGEHGDLNIRSKTAWFIELAGKRMYFGADSANVEPKMYQHIAKITGELDILAIGMECVGAPYTWLYGALTTDPVSKNIKDSRRLNGSDFDKASNMIKIFNAKQVLIYALGLEPWYGYFMGVDYSDDSEQIVQSNQLLEHCSSLNIPCERAYGIRNIAL
ncbi:MBL fold metallo-hydrolase [Flocculibacter collagenilyticus]|uniref:MBL fold metallo-hydrolase n=1 Tax=Flocculibacter collagenilyticus TaxID=2744479 RepID=UPI0018F38870|nr:MBL fold metallo-hydrolase [Flocculibacter collagenilyticus]